MRLTYRIAEEAAEQRITHARLSEWVAKGNGVYRTAPGGMSFTIHGFSENNADDPIDLGVEVRRWEDKEWHEPTVGYCFPEEVKNESDNEVG